MKTSNTIMVLAVTLVTWGTPAFGANIAFEFNMDGVLPSAQGATYITGPGAGVPESTVFSASGGILTQNTAGMGASYAYFGVNGFDHTLPTSLEWRVRLSPSSLGNTAIELTDTAVGSRGFSWGIFLSPTNVSLFNLPVFTIGFDTTDALHTYRLEVPADSTNFELFIDGVSRLTGMTSVTNVSADAALAWGDVSSADGDTFAQWDFIRLTTRARLSIEVSDVRLCWNSESNKMYQIQYRSELTTNAWVNLGASIAGNGTTNCVTDAVAGPRRFYQLVILP